MGELATLLRMSWDSEISIMSQTSEWMRQRRKAADRIEELEAQLAEVTAERDKWVGLWSQEHYRVIAGNFRAEAAEHNFRLAYDRAEAAEAAIPVAYEMGLEAAAIASDDVAKNYSVMKKDGSTYEPMRVQSAAKSMVRLASQDIRALAPPADLVEQATAKVKGHTND